ncbi:GyrI-like domain-containing protein [Treponema sp. C6A8]|uniref:GyrI-like domain-containing protein n=1 Tax=Treponema sp. C6A8 TaxID=1410609 RepID=UPI00048804C2|nr:GyrI-like domain-containing protein [Treponema sp. C6A8]
MAFDFKKEYKEFYLPPKKAQIVTVPEMQYVAVRGKGNPNEEGGDYQKAVGLLYAISYTIKMSKKGDHRIEGYFDYVVPPLEGFWWQDGTDGCDYSAKESFYWISVMRLPDFVTKVDFDWAVQEVTKKKGLDCSRAELLKISEGKCVQIMHVGSYDEEPASIKLMNDFLMYSGYENDFTDTRLHHEIYLSDPRKTAVEKLKTVIRHPVKKI